MPTVKELRAQAKSYGLRGYSTLRKRDLIRQITEARVPVFLERVERALKTGRYPALRGDIDNPHKKAQRIRELHQLQNEVTVALRAQKYEQEIKKNPVNGWNHSKKPQSEYSATAFEKSLFRAALSKKVKNF